MEREEESIARQKKLRELKLKFEVAVDFLSTINASPELSLRFSREIFTQVLSRLKHQDKSKLNCLSKTLAVQFDERQLTGAHQFVVSNILCLFVIQYLADHHKDLGLTGTDNTAERIGEIVIHFYCTHYANMPKLPPYTEREDVTGDTRSTEREDVTSETSSSSL